MNEKQQSVLNKWHPWLKEFANARDMFVHMPQCKIGSPLFKQITDRNNGLSFDERFTVLLKYLLMQEDPGTFGSLLDALRSSGQEWISDFLKQCEDDDDEGFSLLTDWSEVMERLRKAEFIKEYARLIAVASEQANAKELYNNLKDRGILNDSEVELIGHQFRNYGNLDAIRFMISILIRKEPGWVLHLAEIAARLGYENLSQICNLFREDIYPGTKDLKNGNMVTGTTMGDATSSLKALAMDDDYERPTTSKSGRPSLPQPQTGDVKLRNYQLELATEACEGRNVIICAPTGCGKTHVASYIMKCHIEKKNNAKVVFFVPKVSLAKQQCVSIQKFLGNSVKVEYLTGRKKQKPEDLISFYDVLVLTPEILKTSLETEKISSICQFSLLVFDECHKADQGHPYMNIMHYYFNEKYEGNAAGIPQVVGLTATPGTGRKTDDGSIQLYMKNLCANLDAERGFVTVEQNIDELNKFTPTPEESDELVEDMEDKCTNIICEFMTTLVQQLTKLAPNTETKLSIGQPTGYKGTQQYQQWCDSLQQLLQPAKTDGDFFENVLFFIKFMKAYNNALDMYFTCRTVDAIEVLKHLPQRRSKNNDNEVKVDLMRKNQSVIKQLTELIHHPRCQNKILSRIEDMLVETFTENPQSRVILSVQKREYTVPLVNWLMESERLKKFELNPRDFTGTGNRGSTKGKTHKQQEMVLDTLKSGSSKIIVSTPEAINEGVDVDKCNLVICYNFIKNEIGYLQLKGRVRHDGGKIHNFSSRKVSSEDAVNIKKAYAMQRNIKVIIRERKSNPVQFYNNLKTIQENTILEYKVKLKDIGGNVQQQTGAVSFMINCKSCQITICNSEDIRVIGKNLHFCSHPEFESKIELRDSEKGNFPDITCKNCYSKLGNMTKYRSIRLHCLSPEYFCFVNETTGENVADKKQWKKVPFTPKEMSYADLCRLFA